MRKTLCILLSVLICVPMLCGLVSAEAEVLTIATAEDFLAFAENCRLDSYSQGLTVKLTADIDLTGKDFQGIPIFYGSFDGGGHKITGIRISASSSNIGLFRILPKGACVISLVAEGFVAPGGTAVNIGGIAGNNAGLLKDCRFSGEISGKESVGAIAGNNSATGIIENCTAGATVSAGHFVGGIAGSNSGVIRDCKNEGNINTTEMQNKVELGNITVDTLTGTESAFSATDIGGIVGISSGTVRRCENTGAVGYPHIGYNVGGIAGSQSGFITECKNSGTVNGRKDVGGIVGQIEPNTTLRFDKDTLQILGGQLETLAMLTNKAEANAANTSSALSGQLAMLKKHIADAKDAANRLVPEEGPILGLDTIIAAGNDLGSSLTQIRATLQILANKAGSGSQTMVADIKDISDQIANIEATLNSGKEHIQSEIADISDLDTEEDTSGKVSHCVSAGAVQGDRNIGGIAGTVNFENDLDPESDVTILGELSLNQICNIRAVIRSCQSNATVIGKKQHTGGIVGVMTLGLVRKCNFTGTVTATEGKYTGGIAGNATGGFIRNCFVKAPITGNYGIGGIAGSAVIVSDCLSVARLEGTESLGAILGKSEDLTHITENFYLVLDKDPGAIDGISYAGRGFALPWEDFLALEMAEESFKTATVTFCFPDGTETTLTVPLGSQLTSEQIPVLPTQNGSTGTWVEKNGESLHTIFFDSIFEASYDSFSQVLQSEILDKNGRPIFLAQGNFLPGTSLQTEKGSDKNCIASWTFSVGEGSQLDQLRLMLPEGYKSKDMILQLQDHQGAWRDVEFTVEGMYLVFFVNWTDTALRLVEAPVNYSKWILLGTGGLLLAGGIIVTVVIILRKKATVK